VTLYGASRDRRTAYGRRVTPRDEWLAATWPLVRDALPPPPARGIDLGCGRLGGFVPALRDDGYIAVGVDPEAPEGPEYARVRFEEYEPATSCHALIAATSLHHVHDPGHVGDRIAAVVDPDGRVIVIEWAWERFDEASARWAFSWLPEPAEGEDPGWLHTHRDRWTESGLSWSDYLRDWAASEGLHRSADVIAALEQRFDRRSVHSVPYLFSELGIPIEDEQDAIAAGTVQPSGCLWVGQRPA